ncbi:MAG: M15 family metallopeptidase [Erysipelotrichaceae bacterium]
MKKYTMSLLVFLLLSGCSNTHSSQYNKTEIAQLKAFDVYQQAKNDCAYPNTVKSMLTQDFNAADISSYCALDLTSTTHVQTLLDQGIAIDEIQAYLELPYFRIENVTRYQANPQTSVEETVLFVNMNLDLEPYSQTSVLSDLDDVTMLINKYNALPEGYVPNDLVEIQSTCVLGVDYSCTMMEKQELRRVAATAFEAFAAAAREQAIDLVAIASYRTYAYQYNLYHYGLNTYGQTYADTYYARPGQSEHNSGLAVDVTFNGYNFNQIEQYEDYGWVLNNAHRFGFILRYPEAKTHITQYGYESWHFRYVGEELAALLYEQDWTLEEYDARKESEQ